MVSNISKAKSSFKKLYLARKLILYRSITSSPELSNFASYFSALFTALCGKFKIVAIILLKSLLCISSILPIVFSSVLEFDTTIKKPKICFCVSSKFNFSLIIFRFLSSTAGNFGIFFKISSCLFFSSFKKFDIPPIAFICSSP